VQNRFAGLLPGIAFLGIAPWLSAYLLAAILGFLLFKRLLRVH